MADTYLIPEGNLDALRRRLTRLSRRAANLGLAPIGLEVVGERRRERAMPASPDGAPGLRECRVSYEVRVTGAAPSFGEWDFLGVVVRGSKGRPVRLHSMPGRTVPREAIHEEADCDHCRTRRRRTFTYAVRRRNGGETLQVGSTCVADFLGHSSSDWVVGGLDSYRQAITEASDAQEDGWGHGSRAGPRIDTTFYVAACHRAIADHGWVSASQERDGEGTATWRRVREALEIMRNDPERADAEGLHPRVDDHMAAVESLEWARSGPGGDNAGDFLRSLALAADQVEVAPESVGLMAALVPAHHRSQEKARRLRDAEALAARSLHIGEIGERLQLSVSVEAVIPIEREMASLCLVRMCDGDGNALTWLTSPGQKMRAGRDYEIRGTVKAHREYSPRREDGTPSDVAIAETSLSRVAVVTELETASTADQDLSGEDMNALEALSPSSNSL